MATMSSDPDMHALEEGADDGSQVNRISATVDETTLQDILKSLENIRQKLPFLIQFKEENRPYMLEIDEQQLPFLDKTTQDARKHTELVPPFLDIDEFERDLSLFRQMLKILKPAENLTAMLRDTAMAAGCDAFESALVFYKRVRMGAQLNDPEAIEVMSNYQTLLQNQQLDASDPFAGL